MTLTVEKPAELVQHVGRELGPSDWMTVDQAIIDKFAEATGDHQWIHVDVERAKREMPGGKTIAHGYLTLALVPRMAQTLVKVTSRKRGLNYGSNKSASPMPCPPAHASDCAPSRSRASSRWTATAFA
jgi:acyl dehydratase